MRNIVIIALVLPLLTLADQPAKAAYNYPWCAVYANTTSRSCAFASYAQCQAELSGIGGYCYLNPSVPPVPPPAAATSRRGKPRHVRSPQ